MYIKTIINAPSWTDVMTAFGTVGATAIAVFLAVRNNNYIKNEKLSGISITDISDDAVVTLENNAKIDISANIEKSVLTTGLNKKLLCTSGVAGHVRTG